MPPPPDQEGSARDLPCGTGRQAHTHQYSQSRHGQGISRLEQAPMQRPPDRGPIASTWWPTRGPPPHLSQTGDISGPHKAPPPFSTTNGQQHRPPGFHFCPNATWCRRQGILTHCPPTHLPSLLSLLPPSRHANESSTATCLIAGVR